MLDLLGLARAPGLDVQGWTGTFEKYQTPHLSADGNTIVFTAEKDGFERAARISGLNLGETQPPTTTHSVSPTTPASTWHKTTPVNVNLTATDNTGGSGVKEIRYAVDMGAEQTVSGASASLSLSTEGIHSISYWAVDYAGNVETTKFATVKIDKTAPTVATTISNRVLTATASDAISGVKAVWVRFDDSSAQAVTGPVLAPPAALTSTVWAEDHAGNVSDARVVAVGSLLKSVNVLPSRVPSGSSATATVDLSAPAPAGGVVLSVASSDPNILAVPATVVVPEAAVRATFSVSALRVTGDTLVRVDITFGSQTLSRAVAVVLPVPKSLTVAPSAVVGGATATATVTLSSKAPPGGLDVALTSLDPALATVPATVTVPAGSLSVAFPVFTTDPSTDRAVLLVADIDGESTAAALWVRGITLVSATLSPASVTGGTQSSLRVTVSRPAPAPGLPVALSVAGDSASLPPSVTIPAGATTASVVVATSPVPSDTTAVLRARLGGTSVRADLAVNTAKIVSVTFTPSAVKGGSSVTATLSLSGKAPSGGLEFGVRSGSALATVPSAVVVPGGASSVSFPVTTVATVRQSTVTITATRNREVRSGVLTVRP